MSRPSWSDRIPAWVWLSFLPIFGGLAIVYAGRKTQTAAWIYWGLGLTVAAIALIQTPISPVVWLLQFSTAFYLKPYFLRKTLPKAGYLTLPEPEMARVLASAHSKIDINTCSKDDMVYGLGLPIVYANEIDALRREGYLFTHLEELAEIAGLPDSYLHRLEPLVMFSYHIRKEAQYSWRCLNSSSVEELVGLGLEPAIAQKIVDERCQGGEFKSVLDIKRRTGLPFHAYQNLL
jgi:DNA uptake protein ComE-like DNA-binding protein